MRIEERVQGRVGALRRPPKAFGAARHPHQASKLVIVICILAITARLILINQPYVDHWSWRQSDVAAIARNFLQNRFHFAYPQIDWAGNAPGYVGTEFPILPFIAALCYKIAGVHEWIGRIQAVVLFAVSLPFFFLLVREVYGSTAAVWATFFYGFAPANIFAGRSFMPDVPSLSLAIIGLYLFLRWMEDRKPGLFSVAAIAISMSLLIKITSIVIVAPLAYLAVAGIGDPGPPKTRLVASRDHRCRLQLLFFSAIVLLPSAIWYCHAYQIAQKFYPHHFFGAGGIRVESLSWYWPIAQQTLVSSLTPVLSLTAIIGVLVPQSRDRRYSRLFARSAVAGSKILSPFLLVAGCHGSLRDRGWLRQSAPLVPTSPGADQRRFRGCGLRVYQIKRFLACCRGDIVDPVGQFIHDLCLLVRATILSVIGTASPCRYGIEKRDSA